MIEEKLRALAERVVKETKQAVEDYPDDEQAQEAVSFNALERALGDAYRLAQYAADNTTPVKIAELSAAYVEWQGTPDRFPSDRLLNAIGELTVSVTAKG